MKKWNFRPWGSLEWVLNRCPQSNWSILGSLSTEDRWISAWWILKQKNCLANAYYAMIEDEPSHFETIQRKKLEQQKRKFLALKGHESDVCAHRLLAPNYQIVEIVKNFVISSEPNIILDISSLPKRFFFPFIKILLTDNQVKNLIVTYTIPRSYTHEPLAEDYQDWRPLPLFTGPYPPKQHEILIASVGYMTMGLPEQIEKGAKFLEIKLIFPFPPGPPSSQRCWEFVRYLEKNSPILEIKIIDARDVSDVFDHLLSFTMDGSISAIFAPYGPKTISLAMSIFATLNESAVYYTQPTTYHPDYSRGILKTAGFRETYAYCLKLNGQDLYSIPGNY